MSILVDSLAGIDILAQASGGGGTAGFRFNVDSTKGIVGALLGLILLIAFAAAAARIAWEFFISNQQGGADMGVIWKMVIGIVGIVIFSIIWAAVFGNEFIVDANLDDFDNLRGGSSSSAQ